MTQTALEQAGEALRTALPHLASWPRAQAEAALAALTAEAAKVVPADMSDNVEVGGGLTLGDIRREINWDDPDEIIGDAIAKANPAKWEDVPSRVSPDREALRRVVDQMETYAHASKLDLRHWVIHLRAGLRRLSSPVGEWRPIETVPTDDTLFLAVVPDGRVMIWNGKLLATARNQRTPNHLQFPATHWMPLPPAPPQEKPT